MTPDAWRALAHRYPRRVVYPEFNPERRTEPWKPIQENREFWKRTAPVHREFRTVQQGWPSDPVPADPPSGMKFTVHPGRDAMVMPRSKEEETYLARLQRDAGWRRYY